ncbi:MAG: exonuclease domain-containing protein [Proteobacteria bacterium]|nr:exonuclease domain-containing protein [Pseudomonadota bacterium]
MKNKKGFPEFLKNKTLAVFDTETTGLNPNFGDRVCEVAVLRWENGEIVKTFQTLVEPLRPVSPGAFAVNGITPAMLIGKPLFEEVAREVMALLRGAVVICHNAPFDFKFLIAECRMAGVKIPEVKVIDTLALAREHFQFHSNRLGELGKSLGIKVGREHRALADVKTTLEVFLRLARDLEERGMGDLEQLINFSVEYAPSLKRRETPVPPEIEEALEKKKLLHLMYISADGEETERLVEPLELITAWDAIYLRAFCRLRKSERHFRLDRIVKAAISK